MPHLPRVPAFPIAGERSIITAAGAALKIPAKEKNSPLIGHFAPEIIAKDHLDREVSLHATIELGRPIVLYFFPLAGSPHCTKESCSFRDAVGTSPIFNDLNAVVIGISQDPPARSKRFVDEHHLGFRILHDSNRQIMDAWGVGRGLLGLIDGRCTFIIDHEGIVRAMLDGVWDYQGHRNFAEKWLCRIEHELSGRERFYMEHESDETVACDELSRNVKVVYGDAVPARGIASAPRHGAAPAAHKSKNKASSTSLKSTLPPPPKGASLSIAAEANASGSIGRAKSRRNLKAWLRPSGASGANVYDEPLHVDYKLTNRSFDDVTRDRQRRSKQQQQLMADSSRAARSTEKVASRVRSLRLDDPSESSAAINARDFAAATERSSHSRQGSGSGSGWATPSTISARSISTGETSHTSPGAPDSKDSAHAATLAAAIKNGIVPNGTELERSGSSCRRVTLENGNSPAVVTSARSSSLLKKVSVENAAAVAAAAAAEGSTDSRMTFSPDAFGKGNAEENGPATVYANGNIARMPLLPSSVNGERSGDSMATILDRRGRVDSFSNDSTYHSVGSKGSLPVPPRPSARNVAGGAVAAAASARLQKSSLPSSPTTATVVSTSNNSNGQVVSGMAVAGDTTPQSETSTEDDAGYATDRVSSAKPAPHTPPRSTSASKGTTPSPASRRPIPPQPSAAPTYTPPPIPSSGPLSPPPPASSSSPSTSFVTGNPNAARTFRAWNGHPSPSATFSGTGNVFNLEAMERRLSNTPSVAPSMFSAYDASSEYGDYSPSIADSTHTFGGLED